MRKTKDTPLEAAAVIAPAGVTNATPATTPAMMDHYRRQQFLSWISKGLDKDGKHFRYTACCEGDKDDAFYFLRYGKREAMAFPAGRPNPLRYLAGIANSILQPDYELRRFRDKKLGKDGILMPLAPQEWEALATAYGPMAVEARFSPIHRHIETANGRRRTMGP